MRSFGGSGEDAYETTDGPRLRLDLRASDSSTFYAHKGLRVVFGLDNRTHCWSQETGWDCLVHRTAVGIEAVKVLGNQINGGSQSSAKNPFPPKL